MLYPFSKIRILLAFFLLIAATAGYGQLFTTNLQGNSVNGIVYEEATGYLLFATDLGLWKFDGKDFGTLFFENLEDVVIDHDKRIWLGSTANGLFIKNGSTWKHILSDSGAPSDNITDLFVDSSGRIWVSTSDSGVGIFDGQLWHRLKRRQYEVFENDVWVLKARFSSSLGPKDDFINAVYEDNEKRIWIGSKTGARRFSGTLDSTSIAQLNNWCSCLDGRSVFSFINGPDGRIWAGTEGTGVFLIESSCQTTCTTPDTIPAMKNPLNNKIIHDIKFDREGNLWFGTDDGVGRYNPSAGSFRYLNENAYPGLRIVKTVFTDLDNNLWFGISEYQGVIRLNNNWFTFGNEDLPNLPNPFVLSLLAVNDTLWVGTTKGIRRFKGEAQVGEDILPPIKFGIKALAPAVKSHVWVGTDNGVYLYDANGMQKCYVNLDSTGKSPRKNQVNEIIQRPNEVWIAADSLLSRVRATDCSLIKTYSRKSTLGGLINDQILAIAFDKTGKLWCGTPAGASVYDPPTDKWVATYTTANGLSEDNFVTTIAVDSTNGEVWVGTGSGGISVYDEKNREWQHLDRRTVLADNAIAEIVFSGSGEVFVATPRGVSRRDRNGIWCTFDSQSGLASEYVVSIALQGDLRWFGTYGAGLTRYRPPQTLPRNSVKTRPETFIETRFDVTDKSEVIYRFSAADLNTALNEFRYRYALDDTTQWSEPTSDRFAVVTGITPGPHTFYVQAIDRDGNLDPIPDTDFFTRIDPGMGGSSIRNYVTGLEKIDTITVRVYWPPNLLSKDTEITIEPIGSVKPDSSTLFAFSLTSNTKFRLRRPMTLSFSFSKNAVQSRNLGIFRKNDEGSTSTFLGGTPQTDDKNFSISTAIQDLGIYNVGKRPVDTAALSDSIYRVNAQPRIFSPKGGGHGEQTTISFQLDESNHVRIQIYNLAGRLIKTLKNEFVSSGIIAVPWDGKDKNGEICPTGLYIITIESNGFKKPPPKPIKVMVLNQ